MPQYVRRPQCWDLEYVKALQPGDVYLPETQDPHDDDAPWRVVRHRWTSPVDDRAVCVVHVDDRHDCKPEEFRPLSGVWIANYNRT